MQVQPKIEIERIISSQKGLTKVFLTGPIFSQVAKNKPEIKAVSERKQPVTTTEVIDAEGNTRTKVETATVRKFNIGGIELITAWKGGKTSCYLKDEDIPKVMDTSENIDLF